MLSTSLIDDCEIVALSESDRIGDFDCGDEEINDFFNHDAIYYQAQRLGQTYFFRIKDGGDTVCAFSLSADSLKTFLLPNSRSKKVKQLVPHEKSLQSYPALLIGRLGVAAAFNGQGIGSQLIEFIKYHCFTQYPHIVRFLVVDAYNNPDILAFYKKNGFLFVFSTEEQEKENLKRACETKDTLHTRQMFYDIMRWKR